MFKSLLTATRPKEPLILNHDPKIFVNECIVQYLLTHQVNGVRFLYRNYKKSNSCILNDECNSGKCFQCVAFVDAILRTSASSRILIICQRKQCLEYWQYHIDCFLENVNAKIVDSNNDTQQHNTLPTNGAIIASLDHVLNHSSIFTTNKFDCVIVQDQNLQITNNIFEQIKQIEATSKIVLCSNDLMDDLSYFYEVLKFCDQMSPLTQANRTLTLDEFKQKFGCTDKSVSKRNRMFRQKNLLNACNDFYIRRLTNQFGSQFPPVSIEDFLHDFGAWKTAHFNTESITPNVNDTCSSIELFSNLTNQSIASTTNGESSLLNTAYADLCDFDTQMSPLVYSDSDNEDATNHVHDSSNTASQRMMTPEIACNQEHAARARTRATAKASILATAQTHTTPIKRTNRTHIERISPGGANKRLNYKKLPIQINSIAKSELKSKTYLFRTKKQLQANSSNSNDIESEYLFKPCRTHTTRKQSASSSTSDVQIMSQKQMTPIVINSTPEDEQSQPPTNNQTELETEFNTICPSPDLFTSFSSGKSDVEKTNSQENRFNEKENETESVKIRNVFGPPDECDDIDLLSNTNVDVFEITKNSAFDNVLCSADDRITPLKRSQSTTKNPSPVVSCLSGLRVILPRLNNQQMEQIHNDLSTPTETQMPQPNLSDSDDVIDLTLNESQRTIEINSDESCRIREKTPERKQELTPSTRSCLKRNGTTDETRKKSPYSRLGWLTSSRRTISPRGETPQSRRRLDKWRRRTDESNLKADEVAKLSRPRNLFNEFKSKSSGRKSRNDIPSTSTARSPIIFSDQE
ncbi:uncharacterized protein LOC116346009 [Contarinia nasturtii]|uniref:uncharacterized protein LOC116346009 n=1 Tax=Contarinia nasturtii TaxID=265458 RepID=UPI0012D49C09|nr:uncharacterized protein LOC116346009 [Contarinia nasturtii]